MSNPWTWYCDFVQINTKRDVFFLYCSNKAQTFVYLEKDTQTGTQKKKPGQIGHTTYKSRTRLYCLLTCYCVCICVCKSRVDSDKTTLTHPSPSSLQGSSGKERKEDRRGVRKGRMGSIHTDFGVTFIPATSWLFPQCCFMCSYTIVCVCIFMFIYP